MGKHILISSDDEANSADEEEQAYLVEVITRARVKNDRSFIIKHLLKEYRVKWYEYTTDDDSWEPEENVASCTRLLKYFWREVGKDKKKHPGPPGSVYTASKEWIEDERRHFRKEMRKDQAKKKAEREERQEQRKNKTKAARIAVEDDAPTLSRSQKGKDFANLFTDEETSSESDNLPLSVQQENSKTRKEKAKTPSPSKIPGTSLSSSIDTTGVSKGKFSGLKMAKKGPGAVQSGPSSSRTTRPIDVPKTSPSIPVATSRALTVTTSMTASRPSMHDKPQPFLPPRPRPAMPAKQPAEEPRAAAEDADNFLATIMSFGQSEAQRPENVASKPTVTTTAVPSNLKFAKRWSWAGELFIDMSNAAEKLCDITVHDTSETSDVGFRLSQVVDSQQKSLRFSKCYKRSELNLILQAVKKVDQIAKISPRDDRDKGLLSILMKYLDRRKLTICCAGIAGSGQVAEMIVFPSTNKDLCKRLSIPLRYEVAECLLLVLMPWHVYPSKYNVSYLRPDELRESTYETELAETRKHYPHLASRPGLEKSFRIMGFDYSFITFLPQRKYCIWSFQVDGRPTDRGRRFPTVRPETKALMDVMSFMKAENVGYDNADARLVFVHVGSVRSIRKLPSIVERCCDRPEIRFVTYGTHESVKPSLWGFREIFPLGGVVTFTATALLEHPLRIAELVEQIHKHPHWDCYMLPSVLAVFVRLSCPDEDPLSVYAREPYRLDPILNLIEEGKVALMRSPAQIDGSVSNLEEAERDKWIAAQFASLPKTAIQHVEESWSMFVSEYSNKTDQELKSTIESEIVEDLSRLQAQRAIRENYRRFAVIKAMQDEHIGLSKDGFEWRMIEDFKFGDGFPVRSLEDDVNELEASYQTMHLT